MKAISVAFSRSHWALNAFISRENEQMSRLIIVILMAKNEHWNGSKIVMGEISGDPKGKKIVA